MIVLPFFRAVAVRLRGQKPVDPALVGSGLGTQLRRRCRELGIRWLDAALLLEVAPETLGNWESGHSQPEDRLYPVIIRYLGREPWSESASFPEALIAERRRRGLSIASPATVMGVDEGTLGRWESGVWKLRARYWLKDRAISKVRDWGVEGAVLTHSGYSADLSEGSEATGRPINNPCPSAGRHGLRLSTRNSAVLD